MIIKLTQGQETIVDDEDYEYLNSLKWCFKKAPESDGGYACRGRNPVILMHRLILKVTDSNIYIDHKNGNKLDNRKCNLRIATIQQNKANTKKYKNCISKFKGVSSHNNKWRSQIRFNNKTIYLGLFNTEIEAAKRYNEEAIKYFGEFAKINEFFD